MIRYRCYHCGVTEEVKRLNETDPVQPPEWWQIHFLWIQESDTGILRTIQIATCSKKCMKAMLDLPPSAGDLWQTPKAQA